MPKMNKSGVVIVVLAVVVIVLLGIIISENSGSGSPAGVATPYGTPSATSTAPTGGTAPSPAGTKTGRPPAPTGRALVGITIHLLAPVANEAWTIGQQDVISWDRAAGVSGQIELLDAATKVLVGVIIPQTGPNQTSYTWNTRDIYLSRTSPSKKTVVSGIYVIRLAFDGNQIASVTSPSILITQ